MAPAGTPLSLGADELLHELAGRVRAGAGAAAPAHEWLAALVERRPSLLAVVGVSLEGARALEAGAGPDAPALTVDDVTARSAARAASMGHAVVKPEDLAAALLDAAGTPASEPELVAPLSSGAEQLLGALTAHVTPGAGAAGAHHWAVALAAVDAALVARVADRSASEIAAAARERIDAGDEGTGLTGDELARRAGARAAVAGRPVARSEDLAAVLLDLASPTAAAPPAHVRRRPTRTFRVFVSSTFDDLTAERDVLQRRVFPELRALCRDHDARFQAIDLRWGVGEEASMDQQTMNVCLAEIERCRAVTPRPNFVVLLGQHYGWRPLPSQVDATEFQAIVAHVLATGAEDAARLERWYELDENAVPPQYRLRPRAGEYVDATTWLREEAELRRIVGAAAEALELPPDARRKYETSATEQEIEVGALSIEDPGENVLCVFRTIEGTPGEHAPVGRFIDDDQAPISRLRSALEERLPPECIVRVPARWVGDAPKTELDALRDRALDLLRRSIQREMEDPSGGTEVAMGDAPELVDPTLDEEGLAHRTFGRRRSRVFVGRVDALRAIAEHLDAPGGRALAVVGSGGTGKSTLLARAVHDATAAGTRGELVVRFIGATAESSDLRSLLGSLCRELARKDGGDEASVPSDDRELVVDFRGRLGAASSARPLVLVLDALDQLSPAHHAHDLSWLPTPLPDHVHLVLSSRPGAVEASLERLVPPDQRLRLGPMSRDDGDELLGLWLDGVHRTLQPVQRGAVLDAFAGAECNPLYLRLAFEQARRWTSTTTPPALPTGDDGVTGIIERLVDGLEHTHGRLLVARTLGYLAASRHGLTEDELLDVLSRDVDLYEWFFTSAFHVPPDLAERAQEHLEGAGDRREPEAWLGALREGAPEARRSFLRAVLTRPDGPRLPVVLWARLAFELEPYLTERLDADGTSLLAFFHVEVDAVARARYLAGSAHAEDAARGLDLHSRLADYFRAKADPTAAGVWDAYPRGLAELPYHLTEAERWDDVSTTLTDFTFLERKATDVGVVRRRDEHGVEQVTHTGVFLLQDDFDHALDRMPRGDRDTERLPITVTAVDFGDGPVIRCPFCNRTSPLRDEWLEGEGALIACPQEGCDGRLKVNPFVAGGART